MLWWTAIRSSQSADYVQDGIPKQRSKESWSSQSADYVHEDTPKQHSKEQPADPVDESSESNLVIFLPQSF